VHNHDTNATEVLTLAGSEFIRRFLLHVLPRGFVRIRYYGVLAVRNRKTLLVLCMRLTNTTPCEPKLKGLKPVDVILVLFGKDITRCPRCATGTLVPWGGPGRPP